MNDFMITYSLIINEVINLSLLAGMSKMMYYPTHIKEIYRIMALVGKLDVTPTNKLALKEYIGDSAFQEIQNQYLKDSAHGAHDILVHQYDYLVEQEDYEVINEFFKYNLGFGIGHTEVTVFDPFAGEGDWLTLFKTAMKPVATCPKITLIANELEKRRYSKIKENNSIDFNYNEAFEKLNAIPSNSVSLLLYNPPYGNTNGERNVERYLKTIVERDIICRADVAGSAGKIVMVIRKDDLINSLPTIVKHFEIDNQMIYKTHEEEHDKFKQYVVVATKNSVPLDETNTYQAKFMQRQIDTAMKAIESEQEYSPRIQPSFFGGGLPHVEFAEISENLRVAQDQSYELSDTNNQNWQWLMEDTELKEREHETIDKPVDIKVGELANIIASGMVDGVISCSKRGKHIVAGGVESRLREEQVTELDRKGKEQDIIKTTLYSEPYLNVLVSDNGKAKIKKLFEGGIT